MVSVLALYQASKYVFPETQLRDLTSKFYLYMCLARRKLIDERSYENLFLELACCCNILHSTTLPLRL